MQSKKGTELILINLRKFEKTEENEKVNKAK